MKSAIWHDSKNVVIPVVRSPWLRIRRPVTRTGPSPHPDTLFEFRDSNGLFPPCRRDRFASPRTTDRSSIYRWHLTVSPAIADLCCVEVESVQRRKLPPPPTDRGERLAGQTLDSRRPGCPPPLPLHLPWKRHSWLQRRVQENSKRNKEFKINRHARSWRLFFYFSGSVDWFTFMLNK